MNTIDYKENKNQLYVVTPTVLSNPMSKHAGFNVYLKLENLQKPGSFKIRGSEAVYKKAIQDGYHSITCASAGNAGITSAFVANQLGVPITVVMPVTTPQDTCNIITKQGATILKHGMVFDESYKHAMELASKPGVLPPNCLQSPEVWEAYSTIITEAKQQMPCDPDVIMCCVGRGDLLNGIIHGMKKVGWNHVPLVAMETDGAHSYNTSVEAGKNVPLTELKSIAKCLGALRCSNTAIENHKKYNIISRTVPDKTAVMSCLRFVDDHRMLVDVACGATLSAIYGDVIKQLQDEGKLGNIKNALVVVCGGCVTFEMMLKWKNQFDL